MSDFSWRQRWRALGLCADQILPHCYTLPVLDSQALFARAPKCVTVPGAVRQRLDESDRKVALEACEFLTGYIAEHLPAQVCAADLKQLLPNAASALAVREKHF